MKPIFATEIKIDKPKHKPTLRQQGIKAMIEDLDKQIRELTKQKVKLQQAYWN